ncbi:hypothetical protein B0H14DRAFT_2638074 [Mycena olivaceomarginata]|nr:hypothetical protein B0H14DRAFT_2638074 [Mycena olivaceomarginata]
MPEHTAKSDDGERSLRAWSGTAWRRPVGRSNNTPMAPQCMAEGEEHSCVPKMLYSCSEWATVVGCAHADIADESVLNGVPSSANPARKKERKEAEGRSEVGPGVPTLREVPRRGGVSVSGGAGHQHKQQVGTALGVAVIEACGGMESTKRYREVWWRMALGAHWQHGARLSGVGGEPALHAWIGGVGVKDYVRQSVTLGTCAVHLSRVNHTKIAHGEQLIAS